MGCFRFIFLFLLLCLSSSKIFSQGLNNYPVNDSTRYALASLIISDFDDGHYQKFTSEIGQILGCKIKLKETSIKTTLNVRPTLVSIFLPAKHRTYVVRINNNHLKSEILLTQVPLQAQLGLWMHESMHVVDFQERSTFGILFRATQYLSKKGKKNYENQIDKMVVESGYGKFLHFWANFAMYESTASQKYKDFKRSIYLSPLQINTIMEVTPITQLNLFQNEASTPER